MYIAIRHHVHWWRKDKSYGVHVARLAGLPGGVINRAWEVLQDLENGASETRAPTRSRRRTKTPPPEQLSLLQVTPAALEDLLNMDIASMTPLEAINKLYELQERARDEG